MTLQFRLGGTEHTNYMNTIRTELFYIASEKGMLSSAIELYSSLLVGYQHKTAIGVLKFDDWYSQSKAVEMLEEYVKPMYHLNRYKNGNIRI